MLLVKADRFTENFFVPIILHIQVGSGSVNVLDSKLLAVFRADNQVDCCIALFASRTDSQMKQMSPGNHISWYS